MKKKRSLLLPPLERKTKFFILLLNSRIVFKAFKTPSKEGYKFRIYTQGKKGKKYLIFFTIPCLVVKFENLFFTCIPDSFSDRRKLLSQAVCISKLRLLKCFNTLRKKREFFCFFLKNKIPFEFPFSFFFHSRSGRKKQDKVEERPKSLKSKWNKKLKLWKISLHLNLLYATEFYFAS